MTLIKKRRAPRVLSSKPEILFRDVFAGQTLSDKTRREYGKLLVDFVSWIHYNGTRDCFARYRDALEKTDRSASANNKALSVARYLINYLIRTGVIRKNILAGVRGFKKDVVTREHCTNAQVRALFRMIDDEKDPITRGVIGSMLALMAFNGLRCSEVCALRPDDIDLKTGIVGISGKGNLYAEQYLSPEAAKYLKTYLKGDMARRIRESEYLFPAPRANEYNSKPLSDSSMRSILGPWLATAGMSTRFHTLRRYAITNIFRIGGQMQAREFARHRKASTTEMYLPRPTSREIRSSMNLLSARAKSEEKRKKKKRGGYGSRQVVF